MNEIVNKFFLAGNIFIPEMHLRQRGLTYRACRPFTINKERIQKFKETGDSRYIYQHELDKACFQYDMAYQDFKDLARRTASGKVFNIAINLKFDRYQHGFPSMVYNSFDKKSTGIVIKIKNKLN